MTLREARILFTQLICALPYQAVVYNKQLAFGEVERPEEMAKIYKARGVGEFPSAHTNGLAVDVRLYDLDGNYLTKTEDYAELGAYWKTLHPLCRWGGDFKKLKDGNHFSLEFGGLQ